MAAAVHAVPVAPATDSGVSQWIIDNSALQVQSSGLAYRLAKDMNAQAGYAASWGSTVKGSQTSDGWLAVGQFFLPLFLDGVQVVVPAPAGLSRWAVFNALLKMQTPGLGYRVAKDPSALANPQAFNGVTWGSTVQGVLTEDGWVQVGQFYLPLQVRGTQVMGPAVPEPVGVAAPAVDPGNSLSPSAPTLSFSDATRAVAEDASRMAPEEGGTRWMVDNSIAQAETQGLGYRIAKDLNAQAEYMATWGSVVWGVATGDGWLTVGQFHLPLQLNGVPAISPAPSRISRWRVSNSQLKSQCSCLGYRTARDLSAMTNSGVAWGSTVDGVLGDDAWLQVGQLYLPVAVRGKQVLCPAPVAQQSASARAQAPVAPHPTPAAAQPSVSAPVAAPAQKQSGASQAPAWILDNSVLRQRADGLVYRTAKDIGADSDFMATWGSVVRGVLSEDGWLEVGQWFLPLQLHGVQVIVPAPTASSSWLLFNDLLQASTPGLGYRTEERHDALASTTKFVGVRWGSAVRGRLTEGGWLQIGEPGGFLYLPLTVNGKQVLCPRPSPEAADGKADGGPGCGRDEGPCGQLRDDGRCVPGRGDDSSDEAAGFQLVLPIMDFD